MNYGREDRIGETLAEDHSLLSSLMAASAMTHYCVGADGLSAVSLRSGRSEARGRSEE